jgi:hypothetical protein
MSAPPKARRKEERIACELPIDAGNAKGITRDISASGLFFKTDAPYVPENRINLTMDFNTPGGKLVLKCDAEVARIDEPRDGEIGVAVKLNDFWMVPGCQENSRHEALFSSGPPK